MGRGKKREKYRVIPILLLMRCMRPIIREIILKKAKQKTPLGEWSWTFDDFLAHYRKEIERKIKKFDDCDKYINILYPSDSRNDFGKWDLKLMIFILTDICVVDGNSRYYLEDILNIGKQLCSTQTAQVTRLLCKEFKRRLKSARSNLFRTLPDDDLKQSIDRRVNIIHKWETGKSEVDDILERWSDLEDDRIGNGSSKTGVQKYLTLNILLSERCCEVMQALVRRRVSGEGFHSLDRFLRKYEFRIRRRIGTFDPSGRAEATLLPPNDERTQILQWDVALLCWVLLNVCFLDETLADAIGKIRIIRNITVHKFFSSLNVSDAEYDNYLKDIKGSIDTYLLYFEDEDFSEDIHNKIEEIERSGVDKDETIRRLQICQKDRADHELQTKNLRGQASIIEELSEIVKKYKGFEIPAFKLELMLENCSQECEKKLSNILVKKFNQVISEEGKTYNETDDEMTTALADFIKRYKSKGWKPICAENGSVLLEIKSESFDSLRELYESHRDRGSKVCTGAIQEAAQHLMGTNVCLYIVMHNAAMDECLAKIVTNLFERTDQLVAKVSNVKSENKTSINIWMASENEENLPNTSCMNDRDIMQRLTHIEQILQKRYNTPRVSLKATLNDFTDKDRDINKAKEQMLCDTSIPEKGNIFPENSSKMLTETACDALAGDFNISRKTEILCDTDVKQHHTLDPKALQKELIKFYRLFILKTDNFPFPADDETAYIDDVYVPLEMVRLDHNLPHKLMDRCVVPSYRSNTNEVHMLETYSDILHCHDKIAEKIYVTGAAGVGKTTLCKRLVSAWCSAHTDGMSLLTAQHENDMESKMSSRNLENPLLEFEFLFLILLRNTNDIFIEDMISNQLGIAKERLTEALHQHRSLVILDGLDEWSPPKGSEINTIPVLKLRSRCTTLVTSRPWRVETAASDVDEHVCEIAIKGIGDNSKMLINSTFQNMLRGRNSADVYEGYAQLFSDEIRKKKISDLLAIPLVLRILVYLWLQRGQLDESLRHLYENVTSMLLIHASRRNTIANDSAEDKTNAEQQRLMSYVSERSSLTYLHLDSLSQIAYMSLFCKNGNVHFPVSQRQLFQNILTSAELDWCLNTGILTEVKSIVKPHAKASFLHKSFQEYLAALYITSNNESCISEVKETTTSLESVLELSDVFLFLSGMNPDLMTSLYDHICGLADADKRIRVYRFRSGSEQLERATYEKLVKHLNESMTVNVKESLSCHITNLSVKIRDVYLDNNNATALELCLPYICPQYVKSLYIDFDSRFSCLTEKVRPLVEQSQEVVEMIHISGVVLFKDLFQNLERLSALKSLALTKFALSVPEIEQLLVSAPKLKYVVVLRCGCIAEYKYGSMACKTEQEREGFYSNCRHIHANVHRICNDTVKYPELRELTIECVQPDCTQMRCILATHTRCTGIEIGKNTLT